MQQDIGRVAILSLLLLLHLAVDLEELPISVMGKSVAAAAAERASRRPQTSADPVPPVKVLQGVMAFQAATNAVAAVAVPAESAETQPAEPEGLLEQGLLQASLGQVSLALWEVKAMETLAGEATALRVKQTLELAAWVQVD
jgi:hypothetical protein